MTDPRAAPRHAAVILNAGASSRMGRSKAELAWDPIGGGTFLSRAIELARIGRSRHPVVVVSQAPPDPAPADRVTWAVNPHPERGMFSSVQVGLRAVSEPGGPPDATMLLLIDHPLVQRRTVERLWSVAAEDRERVIVPVYAGRAGHPVVLPARAALLALEARADARLDEVIAGLDIREVGLGDPGVVRDIDTVEEYERFFGPAG